jgi:hypothetical protein
MKTTIRYELEFPGSVADRDAVRLIDSLRQRALTLDASYVTPLWRLSGTELLLDPWDLWPRTPARHLTVRVFDTEHDATRPVEAVGFKMRSNPRSEHVVIGLFRPNNENWTWGYESTSESLFGQRPLMRLLQLAREAGLTVTSSIHVDVGVVNVVSRQRHHVDAVRVIESSMLTWMPMDALETVGIARDRQRELERADGSNIKRWSAPAILCVDGRETIEDVIICEGDDTPALGWHALTGLNLKLEQDSATFIDGGPILAGAA